VLAGRFGIPGATTTEQFAQVIWHVWEQIDAESE